MSRRVVVAMLVALLVAGAAILSFSDAGEAIVGRIASKLRGGYTVAERVEMHGDDVRRRIAGKFLAKGLEYPPGYVTILAFKDSRRLEVYASQLYTRWIPVLEYEILGASGRPGPKLREGDRQVPEGTYYIESLNPNSRFHLSIRLDYPNRFDRAQAAIDGRTSLGSDIMIHGMTSSIGCLAMGNEAAEDLFVLAALVGRQGVTIIVAPTDFRRGEPAQPIDGPWWLPNLYDDIRAQLKNLPPFPR